MRLLFTLHFSLCHSIVSFGDFELLSVVLRPGEVGDVVRDLNLNVLLNSISLLNLCFLPS